MGNGGATNSVIRYGSLAVVVLQTTVTVLLLRYSRTRETDNPPYLASTAVLSSECCKFVVCVITLFVHAGNNLYVFISIVLQKLHYIKLFYDPSLTDWNYIWIVGYSLEGTCQHFLTEIVYNPRETAKLIIPSGLYAVQNNLLYLALSNLDAATYQVKIFWITHISKEYNSLHLNVWYKWNFVHTTFTCIIGDLPAKDFNNCCILRMSFEKANSTNAMDLTTHANNGCSISTNSFRYIF